MIALLKLSAEEKIYFFSVRDTDLLGFSRGAIGIHIIVYEHFVNRFTLSNVNKCKAEKAKFKDVKKVQGHPTGYETSSVSYTN